MSSSIKTTIKKLLVNELHDNFSKSRNFTLKEIIEFYREYDSSINKTTVQWRVDRLIDLSFIQRIGRGVYKIGMQLDFLPRSTTDVREVTHVMYTKFPFVDFCVWSTKWFDKYLPFKSKRYITFIEVEEIDQVILAIDIRQYLDTDAIHRQKNYGSIYSERNLTVINKEISGSPTFEFGDTRYPRLEKMIVDLYCDWNQIYNRERDSFEIFLKTIRKDYTINENKLLRYASRRGKKETFKELIQNL